LIREQARRINDLEAADNRRGQELDVIRADRRGIDTKLAKSVIASARYGEGVV